MDTKALQAKTDKDIAEHVDSINELLADTEQLLADALHDYMNSGIDNAIILRNKVQKRVNAFIRNVDYRNIGKEELKALHKARIERFKRYNIKKVEKYRKRDNSFLNVELEVKQVVETLPQKIVTSYRTNIELYEDAYFDETMRLEFEQEENIDELAKQAGFVAVSTSFVQDKSIRQIIKDNGFRLAIGSWLWQRMRTAWRQESTQAVIDDMEVYKYDLIRTSAHADCSDLCAAYQGRIYSQSGRSKKYPPFQPILMFSAEGKIAGGTYKHWNCRHHESIYIPGASDNELYDEITSIADAERQALYERRQKGMYYRRQAEFWAARWRKAKAIGLSKEAIAYYAKKRTYYNKLKLLYGVN